LDQPRLANALRNLDRAGWRIQSGRYRDEEDQPRGPFSAYRFFEADPEKTGDLLFLSPQGKAAEHLYNADDVTSFDFFRGSGDEKSVADPALARRLQEIEREGLSFDCGSYRYSERGAWGAYQALQADWSPWLRIGKLNLVRIQGKTVADLEAALAKAQEPLTLYRTMLLPEVRAGRLDDRLLGEVMEVLLKPVEGLDLQERAELFAELARAVRNGPDKSRDLYTQTRSAVDLYNRLVGSGLKGDEFASTLLGTAGLVATVGTRQSEEAARHIASEIPRESFFPEARQERQEIFLRLLQASRSVEEARRAAAVSLIQVGGESQEERLTLLESLMRCTGGEGATEHYLALLAGRPAGETLQEAAAPYLLLLDGLKAIGKQDEAPRTYTFIREGLRLGRFPQGSTPTGLAERFLELLLLNKDPEAARQGLLPQAPGNQGTGKVEEGEQEVNVGGVVLPRQEGNRS
ncbi:MAG TPA: hypothetical protein VNO81_09295, partial [Candidatus Nitrosotenuis sp.]|nr:hypothetical protein [Candidatus Nitrosotenuis sp.]